MVLTLLLVFVCVRGMEYFGFYLATSGLIVLMLLLLGERRWKTLVLSPAGWSLFVWVTFEKLLRLGLPAGKLWM